MTKMESIAKKAFAVLGGLATFSVTSGASAFGPGPVDAVEIAIKAGGATSPASGAPNALGFGLGVRGGVSFYGFYGGLSFMDYLGSGQDLPMPGAGTTHFSSSSVLIGFEGGYEIPISFFTLRPQVGIGSYTLIQTESESNSSGSLYLEPGVTGLLTFGRCLIGADANVLFLPSLSGSQPAFTAHGQIGFEF